jgi:hypothetical protein
MDSIGAVFIEGVIYPKEQVTAKVPAHVIPKYFEEITKSTIVDKINSCSLFNTLLDQIKDTHEKKNHDYGNSFAKSMDEFGMPAAAIRLSDKLNRFKSLIKSEAQVTDESIEDTLLDMAAYAIMTIEYLKKKKL